MASRIVATFAGGAETIGVSLEREPSATKSGSAGWYNNRAFEIEAEKIAAAQALAAEKAAQEAAEHGNSKGIEIHVGHGLTYETVRPVAVIPEVRELNIGHFIMGEALFVGLEAAVKRMRREIDIARGHA